MNYSAREILDWLEDPRNGVESVVRTRYGWDIRRADTPVMGPYDIHLPVFALWEAVHAAMNIQREDEANAPITGDRPVDGLVSGTNEVE